MGRSPASSRPLDEQQWYRDAVIYEVHVRAFADSDDDGIGDFRGLISKLDYLQDLGVTALWLLPFYPSPLRDDGYDISSFREVNPSYGTLRDFRALLREAHERGLYVITELVLNHTSDQHPWFQRARKSPPGSRERDFYVWSDTPERYQDARVIFQDFEPSNWSWDREAGAYYWHRFYAHQPDLNYDNPEVRRAMFGVVDFWLEMGVDGLRLDAVPYLFERDGTNCENLPETFDYLRDLRRHIDDRYRSRMLLAEANQWPEDAVAYFGKGDLCHMAFHFPVMPRMFMATRMEDRFPIVDILDQTPAIPELCQWAMFLRNHDELTLEMVTDEERDYMYRVYAGDPQARVNLGIRRRLAPLLGNDRNVIEMMNGLLFSLPGTPVVYYGDEIGMGDNIYLGDRNSVRTPMQWSGDRNAGFSRANPQRLYLPVVIDPEYHYEALSVEAQQASPNSLLWWMKRLIALRKRYKAFGRGELEFLFPDNRKVLAFLRRYEDERILVVVNLSRYAQYVQLNLAEFRNTVPVELFGHTEFPPIGDLPYMLTLGPHQFYWFSLETQRVVEVSDTKLPRLDLSGETWDRLFTSRRHREALAEVMPAYLRQRRWFGGKARRIKGVTLVEAVPVPPAGKSDADPVAFWTLFRVEYTEGDNETYALPLAVAGVGKGRDLARYHAGAVVALVRTSEGDRALIDAIWEPQFGGAVLAAIQRRRRSQGTTGTLASTPEPAFGDLRSAVRDAPAPIVLAAEQSNTSLVFGDRLILKIFRRPEEGVNPDLEIGRFLTRSQFPHIPPVAGAVEFRRGRSEPMTMAILHGFVTNEGDAWKFTLDALGSYFERAAAWRDGGGSSGGFPEEVERLLPGRPSLLEMSGAEPPEFARESIGPYLDAARILGRRSAEMHLALASNGDDRAFAPEPFTSLYQRSLYQSLRTVAIRTFRLVRRADVQDPLVERVLEASDEVVGRYEELLRTRIDASRTRIHGDFHLGQVLWTGKDFVIIDFEGEPAVPLGERRIKRTPFTDVAGMIRSFHYAAHTMLAQETEALTRAGDPRELDPWAEFWYRWVSTSFLGAYLETAAGAKFIPARASDVNLLLKTCLLNKAVYELRYEANMRPDWIHIPARGILDLLQATE
ncbi:MAG TPA: maltose alpha-D-glucosyltransferase [Actinomycetota bacterium]